MDESKADESNVVQIELRETGDREKVGVWLREYTRPLWLMAGVLDRDGLHPLLPYDRAISEQLPLRAEIRLAEDE
jgi:hypothetical protein